MRPRQVLLVALAVLLAVTITTTLTIAQGPSESGVATIAPGAISVQGRLTNAGGSPLNGTYTMTFRLYEAAEAGSAICLDIRPVNVVNGLFSDYVDHCYDNLNGQKVWLGIQVEGDPEMTPRQVILPVPYALSLVPGAVISTSGASALTLRATDGEGTALRAYAPSSTGTNYGVYATSNSPQGYAGYFYNYAGGVGVSSISVAGSAISAGSLGGPTIRSSSSTGAALALEGTGLLTSTAKSYVWISGNGLRAYRAADSTIIDLDNVGGAFVKRGATAGNKNVMLPITLPGPLYGQNVRVSAMDIYWAGETEFDVITAVLLRRQTGVCSTASCYATLLYDPADHVCDVANNATGCTQSYTLTTNNTLAASSGILYLTLEFAFNGAATYVEIGGVRLTLEHD